MHEMRPRRTASIGFTAVVSVTLPAAACRQLVAFDDTRRYPSDAGAEAGAFACGLPYGSSACAGCVQAHCCSESTACAGDRECAGYYECVGRCAPGDATCRAECSAESPPGTTPALAPLAACTVRACETECDFPCGVGAFPAPFPGPPDASAACGDCFAKIDCAGFRACASSASCVATLQCIKNSGLSPACTADAGPAARAVFSDFLSCTGLCGAGADWSCLSPSPTPVFEAPVTVSFGKAIDFVQGTALPGVKVSLCSFADTYCDQPIATAMSDSSGNVTVPVPPPTVVGFSGLDAHSYAQATLSGYLTTLFFWDSPLRGPQAAAGGFLALITAAEIHDLLAPHGVTFDTTRGLLGGYAQDCMENGASGVKLSLDVGDLETKECYGPTYDFTATATVTGGQGGFVNVPPGAATVTETPVVLGTPTGSATVLVRANTFTAFLVRPAQ